MNRGVASANRLVGVLVGLLLAAVGVLAVLWAGRVMASWPQTLDLSPVNDLRSSPWWPWALAGAGLMLTLLGLRWLLAHLSSHRVHDIRLTTGDDRSISTVDGSALAGAAAKALESTRGVSSAKGTLVRELGHLVAQLSASLEHGADLTDVARAADQICSTLTTTLGRDDLSCRVRLRPARSTRRTAPRVS